MTVLNAEMSATQEYVPLAAADARGLETGYYTIGSENIRVGALMVSAGPGPT